VDLAYQLCDIKNIVIVKNKKIKTAFLHYVYPHNINYIVVNVDEAYEFVNEESRIVFVGCFIKEFSKYENIIADDFLFKLNWKPENFAMFLSCWFSQGKLKKMGNNFSFPLKNSKTEWLKEIYDI
jgi:hypothetical protein